jgi:hypothetical protein
VARKTSDIALLLGSRGRSRSRGSRGFADTVRKFIDKLAGRRGSGRSLRRDDRRGRQNVSGWLFLIGLLVAFGGGFVVGGKFGGPGGPADLSANPGRTPGFVGEFVTPPLTSDAFIVAAYPGLEPDEAKERGAGLCAWLRDHGLQKARLYEYLTEKVGRVWVVAVYFDGSAEEEATHKRLKALPQDAPDQAFAQSRSQDEQWPLPRRIPIR